ncbi:MAG: cytochrome c [Aggregatilineales bacterium]
MRIMWLSGLLMLLLMTACAGETFDTGFVHEPNDLIQSGETVYLRNCSRCHQLDGEGFPRIYPNLAGNPLVTLHDPAPIIDIVLNGQGSMPGFKNALSDENLAAVISYIRNTWGNEASTVFPKQTR